MLTGTGLGAIPLVARNRVIRIAESRGWRWQEFWSRRNCGILVKALFDTRERLCVEGKVTGLDEIDRTWHVLSAAMTGKSWS